MLNLRPTHKQRDNPQCNTDRKKAKCPTDLHVFARGNKTGALKKAIMFDSRQCLAVLCERNPKGTADHTSNPGRQQIHASLYFSWCKLKARKPKHVAGPRILLQEASDAIARNQPSLDHSFTVWLMVRVSSLYFETNTVGLVFR